MLTTDSVGGVWRYALDLAAQWTARGIFVVLVAMGPRPDDTQMAEAAAIPNLRLILTDLPLDWLAPTPADLRAAAHELAALAARHHAETVHLHTPALVGDATWGCPVVAVAHSCVATWWRAVRGGALPSDLAWRADAVARGLAAADAVIAPSHAFALDLATAYGAGLRIETVWNGRRHMGTRTDATGIVFTAGRLWDSGKNVAVIDAAAGSLDVPVFAAGPLQGPHGARFDCKHLRCLGPLDAAAMTARYAAAGIFVSMSRYEPFGLAVLEAAQAGCALILSDIATFRELWDGAAVFVDVSNANGLAAAIQDCLRAPGARDQLGTLARLRAAQFSVETMAARTWNIHRSVGAAAARRNAA